MATQGIHSKALDRIAIKLPEGLFDKQQQSLEIMSILDKIWPKIRKEFEANKLEEIEPFLDIATNSLQIKRITGIITALPSAAGSYEQAKRTLDVTYISNMSNYFNKLTKLLHSFKYNTNNKSNIVEALIIMWSETGGRVNIDEEGTIRFLTEPIVFQDIEFGRFLVRFTLGERHSIMATALNPLVVNRQKGIHHPHVSEGTICLGAVETTIPKMMVDCDVISIYDTLKNLLNTYSSGSPYINLNRFKQADQYCASCANYFTSDDRSQCIQCYIQMHEHCLRKCSTCGTGPLCLVCSTYRCSICDQNFCMICGPIHHDTCHKKKLSSNCDLCEDKSVCSDKK